MILLLGLHSPKIILIELILFGDWMAPVKSWVTNVAIGVKVKERHHHSKFKWEWFQQMLFSNTELSKHYIEELVFLIYTFEISYNSHWVFLWILSLSDLDLKIINVLEQVPSLFWNDTHSHGKLGFKIQTGQFWDVEKREQNWILLLAT